MKKFILIILLINIRCSTFQFSEYDSYWHWFVGGYYMHLSNTPPDSCPAPKIGTSCMGEIFINKYNGNSNYAHHVIEKRHPYYLWLRTPELIFNPQGGWHYPLVVMIRDHSIKKRVNDKWQVKAHSLECNCDTMLYYHCIKGPVYYKRGDRVFKYGIIDFSAYFFDKNLVDEFNGKEIDQSTKVILSPLFYATIILIKAYELPFYVAHDVIKIPLMPIAAIYFATKEEEK